MVFLPITLGYQPLVEEHAWETSFDEERERRRARWPALTWIDEKTRWRLRFGRGFETRWIATTATPGPVIDIGCGSGGRILQLPKEFTPYGVEISRHLAAEGAASFADRGGELVQAAALEGLARFPDALFTAALLRSFLEHEIQPAEVLGELRRVMRPDGIAFVKVPNYGSLNRRIMGRRWCGFRLPDHVNYFTPGTIRRLATDAGFEVSFSIGASVPVTDNMWAFLRPRRS